jgi:uncharacterized protein (TIGR00369 family)
VKEESGDQTIGTVLGCDQRARAHAESRGDPGLIDANVEKATIEIAFRATEDFTNPTGNVLGAFVAAMLYDTVGPALLATLEPDQFQSTLGLNVNFLRPVRPGRLIGKGRVVHRDGDIASLEASLLDSEGTLIATATATARVIALDQARSAA